MKHKEQPPEAYTVFSSQVWRRSNRTKRCQCHSSGRTDRGCRAGVQEILEDRTAAAAAMAGQVASSASTTLGAQCVEPYSSGVTSNFKVRPAGKGL